MPAPSIDSYKTPLVLLAIDSPEELRVAAIDPSFVGPFRTSDDAPLTVDRLSLPRNLRIDAWNYIEAFELEFGNHEAWRAKFTLYDPHTDFLLMQLLRARASAPVVRVFFQFGWIVDGSRVLMSPRRTMSVLTITPEFLQDGARVHFEGMSPETAVRTLEKGSAVWPTGANDPHQKGAHLIVKEALELASPGQTSLNAGLKAVEVSTPVKCLPPENGDQPIGYHDTTPLAWVRNEMLRRWCVPVDPKLRGQQMVLYEDDRGTDSDRVRYILAPQGWNGLRPTVKRRYHVGKGRSAQVLRFAPTDATVIVNTLGGSGYLRSVSSRDKTVVTHDRGPLQPDQTVGSVPAGSTDGLRFAQTSPARSHEEASQQRDNQWATAQAAAVTADLEVVGDPFIYINEYIEVRSYAGGGIPTAGVAHPDGQRRDGPVLLPFLSGQYTTQGIVHRISDGNYTTTMRLTRGLQQEITDALDAASDLGDGADLPEIEPRNIDEVVDDLLPGRANA